jgi:hypothetical protein
VRSRKGSGLSFRIRIRTSCLCKDQTYITSFVWPTHATATLTRHEQEECQAKRQVASRLGAFEPTRRFDAPSNHGNTPFVLHLVGGSGSLFTTQMPLLTLLPRSFAPFWTLLVLGPPPPLLFTLRGSRARLFVLTHACPKSRNDPLALLEDSTMHRLITTLLNEKNERKSDKDTKLDVLNILANVAALPNAGGEVRSSSDARTPVLLYIFTHLNTCTHTCTCKRICASFLAAPLVLVPLTLVPTPIPWPTCETPGTIGPTGRQ